MACLYILYSEKLNRFYVGSTDDFIRRFEEHQRGQTRSTASGRPWKLAFKQEFCEAITAHRYEMRIKSWKSRKIIGQIIKDQYLKIAQHLE